MSAGTTGDAAVSQDSMRGRKLSFFKSAPVMLGFRMILAKDEANSAEKGGRA